MGNRLCCDARAIVQQLPQDSVQIDKLIKNFFSTYPKFKSILGAKQPGAVYMKAQKKAKAYNNGIYIGGLNDQKRDRYGLMMFNKGLPQNEVMYYEGQWRDDSFAGKGIFMFVDGSFYEGQWRNGLPNGHGIYISEKEKWKYQGEWLNGTQNGKGKQIFEDSSYYEGQFKNGVRHGKGLFQNHDRSYYKGTFVQGQMQGNFKAYNHNYQYQGQFKASKLQGTGKSRWYINLQDQIENQNEKGERKNRSAKKKQIEKQLQVQYIGEYKQGSKNGFGQYRQKNGLTFKGNWKDGYTENQGIFIQQSKL